MSDVLFLGFDKAEIQKWLNKPEIVKVVVFDKSDENRENFETLYKEHALDCAVKKGPELTMYEGCIPRNLEAYLKKGDVANFNHIYSGTLDLLNSCKNNHTGKEIHDSCL